MNEIRRQVFHIILGLVVVLLLVFKLINEKIIFMVLLVGGFLSFLSIRFKIPVISWFLKIFGREEDYKFPGRGALFFCVGVLLVLKLFSREIALASIMILSLGDSISHIIGGKLKHPLNGLKSIEGSIAGTIVGFLGALFFVNWVEALFGSAFAMFVEGLEFKISESPVDDNIIVPLVAGTVMHLISTKFAIFF